MKLYAGTTEQIRADTQMHRIAEKLRAEYTAQIGHKPGPSGVASWQNSLMALSMLLDRAELTDHVIILEYQLGNPSRRLDAMSRRPQIPRGVRPELSSVIGICRGVRRRRAPRP